MTTRHLAIVLMMVATAIMGIRAMQTRSAWHVSAACLMATIVVAETISEKNAKRRRCMTDAPNEKVSEVAGRQPENVQLSNDTKIMFCNTFDAIKAHVILCKDCDMYLRWGDGDLCSAGKAIIAREMAYAETTPEFPPNDEVSDGGPKTSDCK